MQTNFNSRMRMLAKGMDVLKQFARESFYLKTGVDITKPLSFRLWISDNCNFKCAYCGFDHIDPHIQTMPLTEWKKALLSIKQFVGPYLLQITGGEPLLWHDVYDLVAFCNEQGIQWGLITNGSALTEKNVEKLVNAKPFNIDISVDSSTAAIHDKIRGFKGSFGKIEQGIAHLKAARKQQHYFPIRIKTTVHRINFYDLPNLVDWVVKIGADSVDLSPVRVWKPEDIVALNIDSNEEHQALKSIIDRLVEMKSAGAPIETSEEKLMGMVGHFNKNFVAHGLKECRVGLRDYHIGPSGDVKICWFYDKIGNVREASAAEIWRLEAARHTRDATLKCVKFGSPRCATSCLAHRSLKQEIQRGLMFLKQMG